MKVLHLLEATGGGTRRHILDLLPALQERGVRCSLVYSPLRNPEFREDAASLGLKGIETYAVPMGHQYQRLDDLRALRLLREHLQTHSYDLLHAHSSNAGMLARMANRLQQHPVPLVYTPHYIALAAGLPPFQRRAARFLEKALAPQTAHYIAVSHHEFSVLRRAKLLRGRNATVIHNGINFDGGTAEVKQENQTSAPPVFVLGCFGRLTKQKNQQLLVAALPRVARGLPEVRLDFFGGGEDEENLRLLAARLGVESKIRWHGELRDARSKYAECDLIVQPSRWEGCSYALLEAMAAGRAVIASRNSGNPELIGGAGVLLPSYKREAWEQAIIKLASQPTLRHNLGEAARKRVQRSFRLETMVEKTCGVYEKVLRQRRLRPRH